MIGQILHTRRHHSTSSLSLGVSWRSGHRSWPTAPAKSRHHLIRWLGTSRVEIGPPPSFRPAAPPELVIVEYRIDIPRR
jgi:hypothetical protein